MNTTRLTLIRGIRDSDPLAWQEIDRIYRPMIASWLRQYEIPNEDVQDITQEVMALVVAQIDQFEHNGRVGAFRKWLRTSTVNMARNHLRLKNRGQGTGSSEVLDLLANLQDDASSASQQFDLQHDRFVVNALLEKITCRFSPSTIAAFRTHVIEGTGAQETADRLGVNIASVHQAKSRVLRTLREEAHGWIDEAYL